MLDKLSAFIHGRILFLARGNELHRFINEVLKDGVVLYHTQRSERGMRAQVRIHDFRRLRRAARLTHTRIRIQAKYGWPFIAARWWRRKGLLIGIALIALTLSVLSQMVLSISVSGNKVIASETIIAEAEKLGLRTWIFHKNLDLNQIGKLLQERTPDAAWIGIERSGTHVEIRIVEKRRALVPSEAGNLVAAKAGLVQDIMVIQGQAQVHEGELVRPGQVLIAQPAPNIQAPSNPPAPGSSSAGKNSSNNQNSSKLKPPLAAKGFVRGRVWYSAEAKVPLKEDKVEESGRVANGWGIKFPTGVIMVTTPSSPYLQFKEEVQSFSLPPWRNWRFPVEIINVKYKELHTVHTERTASEARKLAEEQARAEVQKKLAPGVQVVSEEVRRLSGTFGVERVRVEVETYEDLAVYANP